MDFGQNFRNVFCTVLKRRPVVFGVFIAIIEMDAKRAPQDKLACVSKCSQQVFEALSTWSGEPADADDFLSALVYVLLKANPPRLHSNIQYVVRFGLPYSLMAGESGYYFTNLVGVGLTLHTPSTLCPSPVTSIVRFSPVPWRSSNSSTDQRSISVWRSLRASCSGSRCPLREDRGTRSPVKRGVCSTSSAADRRSCTETWKLSLSSSRSGCRRFIPK